MRARRSARFPDHDYTTPGLYFVTICIKDRREALARIGDDGLVLNGFGRIARDCWLEIPEHFPNIGLDEFVVMPNHIHGIIGIMEIRDVGAQHAAPLPVPLPRNRVLPGSLGAIVRSYKSVVTKRINEIRGTPGATFWQRSYYEHLIRNEKSAERVRNYIRNNPLRWHVDRENPARTGEDEFDLWLDSLSEKTPGRGRSRTTPGGLGCCIRTPVLT